MSARARIWLLGLAAFLLATPSLAERTKAEKKEATEASSEAEGPKLELRVREQRPKMLWHLEVLNTGKQPVRLVADSRLLWFEVKVPGKKQKRVCRLPDELFPKHPAPRATLRLKPGESYVHRFDPRLYCFAAGLQTTLVPGALITPHFGWTPKVKTSWKRGRLVKTELDEPPYIVTPPKRRRGRRGKKADDASSRIKVLHGKSFALSSEYAIWSKARVFEKPKREADPDVGPPRPLLDLVEGSDAHAERYASVTMRLTNPSKKRSLHVYFRRELVGFEVIGPDGPVACSPPEERRRPERQAFTRLRAGRRLTLTARLVELCPRGTFDRPGLYLVNARFDAKHGGRRFGLDAFMGRAMTRQPVAIRVRTGERRFRLR